MTFTDYQSHSGNGGMFRLPAFSDRDWTALCTVYEGQNLAYRVRHIVMFCPSKPDLVMHVLPADLEAA